MHKPLSKTVRERQLKRLKPRHYEVLTRYVHGQPARQISAEMGIGEQRLSVIINSPLFQEALQERLREQDEAIVRRIYAADVKRMAVEDAIAGIAASGVKEPPSAGTADGESSAQPAAPVATSARVQAARFFSRVRGAWVWIVLDYPGERDLVYPASQALSLTNATPWRVYPRSGPPADGCIRYSANDIRDLCGKANRSGPQQV